MVSSSTGFGFENPWLKTYRTRLRLKFLPFFDQRTSYPDGPELLAINITSLTTTGGNVGTVRGEIQIQWNESQA